MKNRILNLIHVYIGSVFIFTTAALFYVMWASPQLARPFNGDLFMTGAYIKSALYAVCGIYILLCPRPEGQRMKALAIISVILTVLMGWLLYTFSLMETKAAHHIDRFAHKRIGL